MSEASQQSPPDLHEIFDLDGEPGARAHRFFEIIEQRRHAGWYT